VPDADQPRDNEAPQDGADAAGESQETGESSEEAAANIVPKDGESPQAAVVRTFLETAKAGDKDKLLGLLTARAAESIEKSGIPVLPVAMEGLEFSIGGVEQQDDKWLVSCNFEYSEPGGASQQATLHWIVKEDRPDQWRISGMRIERDEWEKPSVFDFEDFGQVWRPPVAADR
jgi:hypothetical protein